MTASLLPADFELLDPAVIENPYPFYKALLAHSPVYCVPGTQVYLVSAHGLIRTVLANRGDYSAHLTGILMTGETGAPELFDLAQFGGTVDALANADEPVHAVHRRLALGQLTARRVAAMESEVRSWTRQRVRGLVAAGGGEVMGSLANAIPVLAMARLVGLPLADLQQLLGWAFAGGDILSGTATLARLAEVGTSTSELARYLGAHLDAHLIDANESAAVSLSTTTPASMLAELAAAIGQQTITHQEAVGILVVLVGAAGESTAALAGSALRLLAADASLQAQLRAQPDLIAPFIEEVVRLESPFKGHYRVVLNDVELGGVSMPAGARLMLLWAAANRDPSVFSHPDEVDVARPDAESGAHLGFGRGIHFCIGARLARLETSIIVQEVLGATARIQLAAQPLPRHESSIFTRRLAHLHLKLE